MCGSEDVVNENKNTFISFHTNEEYQKFMNKFLDATDFFTKTPFGYDMNIMVKDHAQMVEKYI